MKEPHLVLNQENLSEIASRIKVPSYKRDTLKKGIVHIGIGGFHRAHQAYYLQLLHEKLGADEWGICGIGLRENDRKIQQVLQDQDHLYSLIMRHPNGQISAQVVGSIIDFILGVYNPQAVIDRMASPDTKIVSLTITEGGYNYDPNTGDFNFSNRDVLHELQHPDDPRTVYGFLTAALKKRQDQGLPPFTILSCDNIEHNGDMTRKMLLAFAQKQNKELADWISKEVRFPNTMVDRITPVTTNEDVEYLKNSYGVLDAWPVSCEPFKQWIVEDKFSNGRPSLEKVGVQFVKDVSPYEKMKLRLLNAGHSVLGILGAIQGHDTIDDCMRDPIFQKFMRAFMDKEASPVLDAVPGIDLTEYKNSLEERFANPNLKDKVSRICSESSAKMPKFLIPTLLENLNSGGSIAFATMVLAAWCYYSDKALSINGMPIEVIDEQHEILNKAAKNTTSDTLSFIRLESIFGSLFESPRFVGAYSENISKIYADPDIRFHMQELLNDN